MYRTTYLTRGYEVKRGTVYKIKAIYTQFQPYVFKLCKSDGKLLPGYYSGYELYRPSSDRQFLKQKIIKKIRRRNKKYKLVGNDNMHQ